MGGNPNRDYIKKKRSNVTKAKGKAGKVPRKKEEKDMKIKHGASKKGSQAHVDHKMHDVTEEDNLGDWQNVPSYLESALGSGEGRGKNPNRGSEE